MMKKIIIAILLLQFIGGTMAQIPTSTRAKQAIKEYTPVLEKECTAKGLTLGSALFFRIFKDKKQFEVWMKAGETYKHFKTYEICDFSGGLGSKKKIGDCKSPEGFYYITPKRMNPYSSFHLSFNIGFPNVYDRAQKYTGQYLMVHGSCVSIGCYAMTDAYISEIWTLMDIAFRNGQKKIDLHIFPFKMTDENMEKNSTADWKLFWENISEGYRIFEKTKLPPKVSVKNKKYYFN